MCQIAVNIPNEVLFDTKMSINQATAFARRAVALDLYIKNGVSIGYCAQIADMTESEFMKYLGENRISLFHFDDEDEFMEELDNARGCC